MRKVRVLLVHNYYVSKGGEDVVFDDEYNRLKNRSDILVDRLVVRSSDFGGFFCKLKILLGFLYSPFSSRQLDKKIREFCPDVVHFHNIFPYFSPSVYRVCKRHGIKIFQTVHNYRSFSTLPSLRLGSVDALERGCLVSIRDVFLRPYMNSYFMSVLLYLFVIFHSKVTRVFVTSVDKYFVMSSFSKRVLVEYVGVSPDRVSIKKNFVENLGVGKSESRFSFKYAVFVGRLTEQKGVGFLVDSWPESIPLVFVGDFLGYEVLQEDSRFLFVGAKPKDEVLEIIKHAQVLVFPSCVYETFGNVVVEAFSVGTPVLCSDLPSHNEHIVPGVNGEVFQFGIKSDFVSKLNRILKGNGRYCCDAIIRLYNARYNPNKVYHELVEAYKATRPDIRVSREDK